MRQHYTIKPQTPTWADLALAIVIGLALAAVLVYWWST
jgi:hypothetical protein